MKSLYVCALTIVTLTSCNSYNKIITIDDRFKEEKSIRLIQELKAYSDEKRSGLFDGADYLMILKTIYKKPELQNGQVTAELTITTDTRPEEFDSLIFIEADGVKFRFYSNQYTFRQFVVNSSSTQTTTSVEKKKDEEDKNKDKETTTVSTQTSTTGQSRQIMKRTINISPDEWKNLSNLKEVMIRCYIETEGVNVHFTSRDRNKFTKFFTEVIKFEEMLNQSSN